jgi:hypothetical protein
MKHSLSSQICQVLPTQALQHRRIQVALTLPGHSLRGFLRLAKLVALQKSASNDLHRLLRAQAIASEGSQLPLKTSLLQDKGAPADQLRQAQI